MCADILIGRSERDEILSLKWANRHGLIAGATGTGKTVTLQVLAEGFANAGVPVFLADVKGDLSARIRIFCLSGQKQSSLRGMPVNPFLSSIGICMVRRGMLFAPRLMRWGRCSSPVFLI
jgi:hypothetical protein